MVPEGDTSHQRPSRRTTGASASRSDWLGGEAQDGSGCGMGEHLAKKAKVGKWVGRAARREGRAGGLARVRSCVGRVMPRE
ncbi:hypothetical protein GCM10010341_40290 [Streptomyces noursei]|nr:hypothetical protein GCM10010341_40290 [Streptomyces noursei]